jgi:putative transposase
LLKTFKYRLRPTGKQTRAMLATLEECRWLYNYFLEQRRTAWNTRKESLNYYSQAITLPALKRSRPTLKNVHSQVLQNVAVRVDLAFKAFFRRVKAGEKPGYPRFRGPGRYDSFCYTQSGFKLGESSLTLSKIGTIKAVVHRPIVGKIKTCCVRRSRTGKWFVALSCESAEKPLCKSEEAVGIDVGLESFATLSDGSKIESPKLFRRDEKALAQVQRRLSRELKGTPEHARRRKAVARVHERIANRRADFAHQHSRRIVNRYGVICIEDLSVNRMVHNRCLSKSIMDAAWSQFANCLSYKAENAGRKFVRVNPAYTSQDCSRCGHRRAKSLSEREHRCECCGLVLHRDHNAALNILSIGLDALGLVPKSLGLQAGE